MSKLLAQAKKRKEKPLEDPIKKAARAEVDASLADAWKSGDPHKIRKVLRLLDEIEDEDD